MPRPSASSLRLASLAAVGQFILVCALLLLIASPGGATLRLALTTAGALLAAACAGTAIALLCARYEQRLAETNHNLETLVARRSEGLIQSRSAVILGLAKLAESRDDETGRHLERIRRFVRILGEELLKTHAEVDRELVETIVETSALHDIGKVGIPDAVLLKPGGLTDEQREVIKKHTLIGGDTLLAVKQQWGDDQFLVTACQIIFAHHERYDGEGYPFGLKGDMIPLSARIVAVADVYDALTNERVYKPALSHEEAVQIITEGRGTHFDPAIVDAFHRVQDEFRAVLANQEAVLGG